jgi:hypothetical protein
MGEIRFPCSFRTFLGKICLPGILLTYYIMSLDVEHLQEVPGFQVAFQVEAQEVVSDSL